MTSESLLIITNYTCKLPKKSNLALFDLDDTIIKKIMCKNKKFQPSFRFLYKNVIEKIVNCYNKGYVVAILSNQSSLNMEGGIEPFKVKVDSILNEFPIPVIFIAALKKDFNRKPGTGMFDFLLENFLDKDNLNYKESFYVGDAAGRNNATRKDHSDCDLKLAYNCGINFYTPEEFFLNEDKSYEFNLFDIRKYKNLPMNEEVLQTEGVEMIFVYGKTKNCGKTFFSEKYFKSFKIVRNERFFSWKQRHPSAFLNITDVGFIEKIKSKFNVRCFFLDYDEKVLHFLDVFSQLKGKISVSIGLSFKFEKYFDNIISVNFVFDDSNFNDYEMKISNLQL